MQTDKTPPLDACLIRVLTATGAPIGVGFLVANGFMCTCAHVVADALGIPRDTTVMPEGEIHVDFPLVAPGQIVSARPILWRPAASNGEGDIAGLELEGPLPLGTHAAHLIGGADLWQHSFRAFGFPQGHDSGVWASGRMLGRQAFGWILIEDLKQTGYRVEPGFSGAPVWDERLQGVVGVVVAAERRAEIKAAFVIPVSWLAKAWPAVVKLSSAPAATVRQKARSNLSTQDQHNRAHMLDKVENFWIKRLLKHSQSQHVQVVIQLKYAPKLLDDPLATIVEQPDQSEPLIPASKPMIDLFDELGGELLMVGAPGAGKTRLLLELAASLIDRARNDEQEPIPVVFNLSTWGIRRQVLDQWLVTELNQRYDIPRRLARRWIDTGIILPLLDGLDEVEADARSDCVEAINRFRHIRGGLINMVVCCRDEDYRQLNVKLRLGGAIAIQPLTLQEAKTYLEPLESRLNTLREALDGDLALWDILDTPLMLNIVISAYTDRPPGDISKSAVLEMRRHQLFDDYIAAMFRRPGRSRDTRPGDHNALIVRLSWLARQMVAHRQDIFLLEQIDTTLLANRRWRGVYHIALRMAGALLFLIACALVGSVAITANPHSTLLNGLFDGLAIGSIIAFALVTTSLVAFWLPKIVAVPLSIVVVIFVLLWVRGTSLSEELIDGLVFALPGSLAGLIFTGRGPVRLASPFSFRWIRPKFWRGFGLGLLASFALGILFGGLTNIGAGITFGLLLGICCTLPVLLFEMAKGNMIEPFAIPNQAIRRLVRTAILIFLMVLCMCILIGVSWGYLVQHNIIQGLAFGLVMGIPIGLVAALTGGGAAGLHHYLLRAVLASSGAMTWRYQRFLDYATDRMFLRRVGSGYGFYHRLLMEHFAKIST